MIGKVVAYNEITCMGLVDDRVGNVYMFDAFSLADDTRVYKGMSCYFEVNEAKTYVTFLNLALPLFDWARSA